METQKYALDNLKCNQLTESKLTRGRVKKNEKSSCVRKTRSSGKKKKSTNNIRSKKPEEESADENTDLQKLFKDLSDHEEAKCVPNGSKLIECFICGEKLTKIYKLRLHMQLHTHVEGYDEKKLEESSIYGILNPHKHNIETKVIIDFLIEEIQAKRYSQFYGILNEADIELHISDSETESEDETEVVENEIKKNNYKCYLCETSFDRRYKALFHQKTIHYDCDLYIKCDYCGCQFICVELLIHHLKTQCECDEKPISCVERFKQYLLKINLEQFESLAQARKELKIQRLTKAQKVYTCNVCQKTFTRSEHLTRHKAVHLPDELKIECPVCFRRFNRKDNMRSHMKVHMDEAEREQNSTQPILCQYCGHCFTSKSNYIVHMRRHTGEKPYKCDVCGKGFPKSTDLNSHKITHTGEKNFVCNVCNKAFARSVVLSKHMRVHAGPFHCNLCEQSFPRPNELAKHLLTHANGLRTCTCIVCSSSFHTSRELEAHFLESGHDNVRAGKGILQTEPVSMNKTDTEATAANSKKMSELTQNSSSSVNEKENSCTELLAPANATVTIQSTFDVGGADVASNSFLYSSNSVLQNQQQQDNNNYESWQ